MELARYIKIILIIFFTLCFFNPKNYFGFQFYEVLKVVSFFSFLYLGFLEFESENQRYFFVMLWFCSAIIINPFLTIKNSKETWLIMDAIWIIFLIISFFNVKIFKSEK